VKKEENRRVGERKVRDRRDEKGPAGRELTKANEGPCRRRAIARKGGATFTVIFAMGGVDGGKAIRRGGTGKQASPSMAYKRRKRNSAA